MRGMSRAHPSAGEIEGSALHPLLRRLRKKAGSKALMTLPSDRSYRWLFWCLALLGLTLDQASKYGVFAWLYNDGRGDTRAIIPGAFWLDAQFTHQRDPGDGVLGFLRTVGGDYQPKV